MDRKLQVQYRQMRSIHKLMNTALLLQSDLCCFAAEKAHESMASVHSSMRLRLPRDVRWSIDSLSHDYLENVFSLVEESGAWFSMHVENLLEQIEGTRFYLRDSRHVHYQEQGDKWIR